MVDRIVSVIPWRFTEWRMLFCNYEHNGKCHLVMARRMVNACNSVKNSVMANIMVSVIF